MLKFHQKITKFQKWARGQKGGVSEGGLAATSHRIWSPGPGRFSTGLFPVGLDPVPKMDLTVQRADVPSVTHVRKHVVVLGCPIARAIAFLYVLVIAA